MAARQHRSQRKAGLSEAPPHYHGHRERLRARFREAGSEAVSDYELLELVLFRAIPQRDVKPLAKDLIAKFGSFAEVVAAPRPRLKEIKGIGDAVVDEPRPTVSPAGSYGNKRCCRHGPASSIIAAPPWPSPTRSSSACCSSTSATS